MKEAFQIIYLNGPSSCGKTTLAKALQESLDEPFLHIGIDKVIGMMPSKLNAWEGSISVPGFSWKPSIDETGHPVQELQIGPFAQKMCQALKLIVLALAKEGHSLIIDDVAFGKGEVDLWKEILCDYKVLWIGLSTPLPKLEERERRRKDRTAGSARAQYFKVHKDVLYDLEFDTDQESVETIVQAIQERFGM